jgi:hypothetical protein
MPMQNISVKMSNTIKIYVLIFFGLFFNACSKDALKENPEYVGQWSALSLGGTKTLDIQINEYMGSSYAECPTSCYGWCQCENETSGSAHIRGNKLTIGNKTFVIHQEPMFEGNNLWTMKLDGFTFRKYVDPANTCNNNIQDSGENGVDCGGTCGNLCYDNFTFDVGDAGSYFANEISVNEVGGEFSILALYNAKESQVPSPVIKLKFNANTVGTYNLNSTTCFTIDINWSSPEFKSPMYMYSLSSGSINITYLNTATRTISATFSFVGVDSNTGKTVEISNGVIEKLKY